jgi:RNA polymerase sigma factor FliA
MGRAGLVEAASRYDAAKGASFSTFAWYRVQGSIIDGLRRQTALPRRVWTKLVALRATSEYLETQSERERGAAEGKANPTTVESLTQVKNAIAAIRTMYMTSLEGAREKGFDAVDQQPRADDKIYNRQVSKHLLAAIESLPERERELLRKHYWEGKNLLEAGKDLGISKSWASRMHAQAVDRLREALEKSTE